MLAVCDVLSGCRFGLRVRMRWFGDLICLNLSDLDLDRFDDGLLVFVRLLRVCVDCTCVNQLRRFVNVGFG